MHPALNYAECAALANLIRPAVVGLPVEKVIVVQRNFAEGGFFKNEWAIRLGGARGRMHLIFSVRSQNPYLYAVESVSVSPQATRSGFEMAMSKALTGAVLQDLRAIPSERFLLADFGAVGLLLNFIPAMTEAFLVTLPAADREYALISRSRVEKLPESAIFTLPAARPPREFSVRADFPASAFELAQREHAALSTEAVRARVVRLDREFKQREDQLTARLAECRDSLRRAQAEPDYEVFGNLLKGSHYLPETQVLSAAGKGKFTRQAMDFSADEWVTVPVFPAEGETTITREIEKLFAMAKRRRRKIEENSERVGHFERELAQLRDFRERLSVETIGTIEREWKERLGGGAGVTEREHKQSGLKKIGWKGKIFRSAEGMLIFVGRNKIENLDLSFKVARGNDVWLHVKAKPGSHVVISIPPKKSASLETLLDAALLCLYYSGGAEWGRTEVDYTFVKYIKKIKNSTEASYTQQKTLVVAFDAKRWERLQRSEVVT